MKAKSKSRVVEPHWRQVELPVVAETACTTCGWCVEVCPTECLALGLIFRGCRDRSIA